MLASPRRGKGGVTIIEIPEVVINGISYKLRFDVRNSTKMDKVAFDKSMLLAYTNRTGGGLGSIRALFWGALLYYQKNISKDRAGNLIQAFLESGGSMCELETKIRKAMDNSVIELKKVR